MNLFHDLDPPCLHENLQVKKKLLVAAKAYFRGYGFIAAYKLFS